MTYLPTFQQPEVAWRQYGDTVGAVIEARAAVRGDAPCVHLLNDDGSLSTRSYRDMAIAIRGVAAGLSKVGFGVGKRALLVLPTGYEFLDTFFGVLATGGTAVPCYPPLRTKGLADYQDRLARLIETAKPDVIVTFARVRLVVEAAAFQARSAARVIHAGTLAGDPDSFVPPVIDPDAIALIQFSSGSTGHPRGVMLSHRALLANVAAVLGVIKPDEQDVLCSWLPLYHDMGLIGGPFMSMFSGAPLVLLSPQAFLLDPKRWLKAIQQFQATISTAPNFAYQILATRVASAELAGLDLSSWRLALCGAEPVLPGTLSAVAERFGPYGFKPDTLMPVYGLAEMALGAVFSTPGAGYVVDVVDAAKLAAERVAIPLEAGTGELGACRFPAVGRPLPGFGVRIVGPGGRLLPERSVGEIELSGPSMMAGYLDDARGTAEVKSGDWLRTGDLGYVVGQDLYVVGRLKDVILKGGRNYAPQDLEHAAELVEGVRRGCVVAFGVLDEATGTEAVVLVAESKQPASAHAAMVQAIGDRVFEGTGLRPDRVVIVPPGAVPKTSSGKLQRRRTKDRLLADQLSAPLEPGTIGMARVLGRALTQRMVAGPLARGLGRHDRS